MIHTQLQQRIQNLRSNSAGGFTMVEVVIAGVLLVSVMTSVAQMSVAALAGSKNFVLGDGARDGKGAGIGAGASLEVCGGGSGRAVYVKGGKAAPGPMGQVWEGRLARQQPWEG